MSLSDTHTHEHALDLEHGHEQQAPQEVRYSDVVPRATHEQLLTERVTTVPMTRASAQASRQLVPQLAAHLSPHLTWRERKNMGMRDDVRAAWSEAYEKSFDRAFAHIERGEQLIPMVYAAGENDARLVRALLKFAAEVALRVSDTDAALAVLEVAESTLTHRFDKDLCMRIAENLIDEAYERCVLDRRFDQYFFCHCAAAIARLSARVEHPDSANDAIEAIQSAVAALRSTGDGAELQARRLAAYCIRVELGYESDIKTNPGGRA